MILTAVGAVLVIVLAAAGALGLWGYSYVSTNVHNQLAYQEVYFPTKAQIDTKGSVNWKERSFIGQYAGQEVLTGPQAAAYAEKIREDVYSMPDHGVYAKLSAASIAHPSNAALAADVEVAFKGTTLQGLLLEAYAFWTIGQVALWGAVISFILAAVVLVLVVLGLLHLRRVPEEQMFPQPRGPVA